MTIYYTYSTDTKTLTRASDPLDGVIHPSAAALSLTDEDVEKMLAYGETGSVA